MTVCILHAVVFLNKESDLTGEFTKYTMKNKTQEMSVEIIFIMKPYFDKNR